MKMILHHVKNVDLMHGQGNGSGYWQPPIDPARMVVQCETLAACRAAFDAWRNRNGIGSGNMARDCGLVRDGIGKAVARFSYNGRAWTPGTDFGQPGHREIIIAADAAGVAS